MLATLSNPGHIVIYAPGEFASLPPCCDSKSLGYYHRFDKSSGTKKRVNPLFFRLNNAAAAFLLPERRYLTADWLLTFP
ncbi:hypothetical protein DRW71_00055 [Salmonella enterica subsp. diarizonae]|nr:hypothetical protein [Salmonella enterica]EBV2371751.1 hypothetical protein [Salmonella enterica subsp. enterica serovar Enteritidis]ECC9188234.1 hypothetical protein [Salmonella enterica subsp. diarizonae]EGX1467262.1 hypothetical protein [Salmonella enterica]